MDRLKRKSNFDEPNKDTAKKCRSKSMTCIEDFSNEIFYEIFDYLNGCQIDRSFRNLNHHFQQILESPLLLFKFTFDSNPNELAMNIYERMMKFNQHQILSIHFSMANRSMELITTYSINSSFIHLESLTVDTMESDLILQLLCHLAFLPRLFTLVIMQWNELEELTDFYRFIFNLPKLKYMKFFVSGYRSSHTIVSLPMPPNQSSISTIEYLVINHPCDTQDLSTIIAYTPHLSHLRISHVFDINEKFPIILPILNLTNLSMCLCLISFDEFEILISKIQSQLKMLRLTIRFNDRTYLDARRWEQFILQYLPKLQRFYLKYFHFVLNQSHPQIHQEVANTFLSPFWIERKWMLETETYDETVVYSIHLYKEKWYDYILCSSIHSSDDQLLKSMHLDLIYSSFAHPHFMYENISDIIKMREIYHLTIDGQIFVDALISICMILSSLDSLRISSLSLFQWRNPSNDEGSILRSISSQTRITKINLIRMKNIEEISFLLAFCPDLIHLRVDDIHDMDVNLFVRLILLKITIQHRLKFQLLCFYVQAADDRTIEQLNKMIDDEKLLFDYTIKRQLNFISFEWNRI